MPPLLPPLNLDTPPAAHGRRSAVAQSRFESPARRCQRCAAPARIVGLTVWVLPHRYGGIEGLAVGGEHLCLHRRLRVHGSG